MVAGRDNILVVNSFTCHRTISLVGCEYHISLPLQVSNE